MKTLIRHHKEAGLFLSSLGKYLVMKKEGDASGKAQEATSSYLINQLTLLQNNENINVATILI